MPKAFRNIAPDLETRLETLKSHRDELAEQIAEIDQLIASFSTALAHERRRTTRQLPLRIGDKRAHRSSGAVARVVSDVILDQREWNLHAITEAVKNRGIEFGEKNPNRVVHFALAGMKRQGLVEIVSKGVWRATARLSQNR